ncbi:MAG: hypothetical protein WD995_12620 [Gemmatimonadota bacterium]
MSRGRAGLRVGIVLGCYALGVLLLLPALDALQRVLFLPELFGRLARVALVVGAPVAVVLAWRYPNVGDRQS